MFANELFYELITFQFALMTQIFGQSIFFQLICDLCTSSMNLRRITMYDTSLIIIILKKVKISRVE